MNLYLWWLLSGGDDASGPWPIYLALILALATN